MSWTFSGRECFRTWYIEEVAHEQLFGVDSRNLHRAQGLSIGNLIYFEDAPYHWRVDRSRHRLVGPFEVTSGVFTEANPQNGPWLERSQVQRRVGGRTVTFAQQAAAFQFFPYRFSIRRHETCSEVLVNHGQECFTFHERTRRLA